MEPDDSQAPRSFRRPHEVQRRQRQHHVRRQPQSPPERVGRPPHPGGNEQRDHRAVRDDDEIAAPVTRDDVVDRARESLQRPRRRLMPQDQLGRPRDEVSDSRAKLTLGQEPNVTPVMLMETSNRLDPHHQVCPNQPRRLQRLRLSARQHRRGVERPQPCRQRRALRPTLGGKRPFRRRHPWRDLRLGVLDQNESAKAFCPD